MLKYINIIIINFLLLTFFNGNSFAKGVVAEYNVQWNGIILGNIFWKYSINEENYKFIIETKGVGVSSKLYPFYGKQSAEGLVQNDSFKPKKYNQVWKTKRRDKNTSIGFNKGRVEFFDINPKETIVPYIDFYKINNAVDPISAALELIISGDNRIIKNIFDGRRVYNLGLKNKKDLINYEDLNFSKVTSYELDIKNYRNIWKDHNKKDLKKVIIITGVIEDKIILPLKFIITNKGLVFKIKYTGHKKNDW